MSSTQHRQSLFISPAHRRTGILAASTQWCWLAWRDVACRCGERDTPAYSSFWSVCILCINSFFFFLQYSNAFQSSTKYRASPWKSNSKDNFTVLCLKKEVLKCKKRTPSSCHLQFGSQTLLLCQAVMHNFNWDWSCNITFSRGWAVVLNNGVFD